MIHDRGEVTIEHTLEVMVAHSESIIENCLQRSLDIIELYIAPIVEDNSAIMLRACKAAYSG